MKKGYLKPEAEYINLAIYNKLMNQAGVGNPELGSGETPPGFDEDEF